MYVCVCGGGGVLLLVFRGNILRYVKRRTTTEPCTKDVVIDQNFPGCDIARIDRLIALS